MKFSFKKFVELVDQEEDLTEEQLDEIFGAFATHDEKQKKIAAQKKAEFDERRKALQAKQKVNPKAGTKDEMDALRDPNDPRKVPAIRPKNTTGPWSANGQGRKAEMDWAAQFEAEEQEYEVETSNGFGKSIEKVKAKSALEAKKKIEDQLGYGHYVSGVLLNGKRFKNLELEEAATPGSKAFADASVKKSIANAALDKALNDKANGADEVEYKGKKYRRSGPKNAASKPGRWKEINEARESVADQVKKDLEEQKKIGARVTAKALAYPHAHEKEMQKYYDNGMSIEEIADMVKDLART